VCTVALSERDFLQYVLLVALKIGDHRHIVLCIYSNQSCIGPKSILADDPNTAMSTSCESYLGEATSAAEKIAAQSEGGNCRMTQLNSG
jgi:hypothetical protein